MKIWPGWNMRSGESETEWLFRLLLQDLQTLASDTEDLIQAYPPMIDAVDQVVNDFDDHLLSSERYLREGLITQEELDKVCAVDSLLDEMSDRHDPALWTYEALRTREEWTEVRRLATEALESMGYSLEPPPPAEFKVRFYPPRS